MTASGAGSPARIGIERRRWTGRDAIVLAGLAVLTVLLFRQVTILGRVFFLRDFGLFFYPKRAYAAEAIRHFQIPFWESYGGCGEPFLGAYQSAVFYPPALIYYFLPMPASFMWFVVFHFFLSGVGAYYMMRAWGVRRAGAAFAAFAWAFCPAFISTVDNVSFQTSLAWLPWCLGFARRIYGGRGFGAFVWLTISFAMAALAGAPEPVLFIAAAVALLALIQTVRIVAREGWGRAWRPAAAVAGALALGAMLSGVELAPFVYCLGSSARGAALDAKSIGGWQASPSDALLLLLPRFGLREGIGGIYWGEQQWLKTVYLGVLVPLLALWTTIFVRRRRNTFFAAAAIIFLVLALGKHSFVWTFLCDTLPGFALVRYPVKYYLPAAFALCVLAGFAVDDLSVFARRGKGAGRWGLVIAMSVLAVVFAASWLVMSARRAQAPGPSQARQEVARAQAAARYESTRWSFGRSTPFLLAGAAALFLAGTIARRRATRPYGALALVLVLLADVGTFDARLNPTAGRQVYAEPPAHLKVVPSGVANSRLHMTPALFYHLLVLDVPRINDMEGLTNYIATVRGERFESSKDYLEFLERTSAPRFRDAPEADSWLKSANSAQFAADLEYEVHKESFYPDVNLLYKAPMTTSFEVMGVARHNELVASLASTAVSSDRATFLARMWGASVTVDRQDAPPEFFYAPAARPGSRAFLADRRVRVDNDREAGAVLTDTTIDVTKSPVLVGDEADAAAGFLGPGSERSASADAPAPGAATVVADTGNVVTVEVDARAKALLVLSDCWYPLIRATVDGAAAPLWRANYAYRAVPVPAGKHVVEFAYEPLDFYAGVAMTLAGAIILTAAWAIRRRRRSRRATSSN